MKNYFLRGQCILYLFTLVCRETLAISCVNENDKAVDWFAVYKPPRNKYLGSLKPETFSYTYTTSDDLDTWYYQTQSIFSNATIFAKTLQPLYEKTKTNIGYVIYNDQPPYGTSKNSKGHTKGVIMFNEAGGFWLTHSIPHFPVIDQYGFPQSGTIYGQTLFCITLKITDLNLIGIHLQYNEPHIYAQKIPVGMKISLPDLVAAASNITVSSAPWYKKQTLNHESNIGTLFAKSKHYGKDLYEELLAQDLKTDFFVETWQDGSGTKLNSSCKLPYRVFNINEVVMKKESLVFKSSHDHSKWATSNSTSWICFSDINRMVSQTFRGGGCICLYNKKLAQSFVNMIGVVQECTSLQ